MQVYNNIENCGVDEGNKSSFVTLLHSGKLQKIPYNSRNNYCREFPLIFLCSIFFPADVFIVKDFKIFPEEAAFILSYGEVNTHLGINTFI